jgi:DNA polymerase III epsilon subunit-like protein
MIIIDVEASGVDYRKHSIVSLGALDFDNPQRRFYGECRVWDGAHIDDGALEINGYTKEELLDLNKQSEAELVQSFMEWTQHMSNRTLVGQNVSFDRDMVKAACDRADIAYDMAHRTIDTHTLCWMHIVKRGLKPPIDEQHRRSALNLDAILNYCGIPSEPEPHNALTGALSHAEVTSRLLNNVKLLPEFSQFEIPWSFPSATI